MGHLAPHDVMTMFLALAALLGSAKVGGELMLKLGQPSVLGEILAGIVLGPTVLGTLAPRVHGALFPPAGTVPVVLDAVATIGVVLFLLTAGTEVDLTRVFRQGKTALLVSSSGVVVPFVCGFVGGLLFPRFLRIEPKADHLVFALFVGTALSISALPVIAKVLMDLNLLRTDLGSVVLSSALFNDLVGWILFSLVLGLMNSDHHTWVGLRHTVLLTLLYVGLMLTLGRWLIDKTIPQIQAHTSWPGGMLAFIFTLTMAAAAFTEYAGIHAVFGAFIMGIAVGESRHLRERTREHIHQIVTNVFAPLFFASIGLRANFVTNFRFGLAATVVGLACVGKILGTRWGARRGGMDQRTSLAVGMAMNARGAMEIILGLLALQYGLIREPMFVALVFMALVTSLAAGPAIHYLLGRRRVLNLKDLVSSRLYIPEFTSTTRHGVLRELCELAAPAAGCPAQQLFRLVVSHEMISSSGWNDRVAVPNARVEGLAKPVVAVGFSREGIDFNARDGKVARLVMLILTGDDQSQLDLLSNAGELFGRRETIDQVMSAHSSVEFMAALNAPVR